MVRRLKNTEPAAAPSIEEWATIRAILSHINIDQLRDAAVIVITDEDDDICVSTALNTSDSTPPVHTPRASASSEPQLSLLSSHATASDHVVPLVVASAQVEGLDIHGTKVDAHIHHSHQESSTF